MNDEPTFYAGYMAGGLFVGMLLALELGFRLGRRRELGDKTQSALGVVQGSLLGTLALLLSFTFSLASQRYDARRILLAQETNAIGTTYLRSTLAPQESGSEIRRTLRDYLKNRLALLRSSGDAAALARRSVEETQIALWRLVQAEATRDPHSEMVALLVVSLNQTIDLESMQRAARAARVPRIALGLVLLSALLVALSLGYGFGVTKQRSLVGALGFAALVSCITFTILDFDRPDGGFIRVSDAMLQSLHERVVRAVDREQESH